MVARLFSFRELGLEIKTAVIFGTISLVLSLVIGIASGNNFGNALITSMILMLVFSGLGYGIILVLNNFVPEFLEVFRKFNEPSNVDHTGDTIDINNEKVSETAEQDGFGEISEGEGSGSPRSEAGDPVDFEPLETKDMKRYNTGSEKQDAKLGKHIVVDQKKVKYEPKIVAEAIRTMMRRDND